MRVTARTYYMDYAQTVNNLHSNLNEAMEQVSTGRKYKDASENPLAYYAGKRMDNQYTDADAKDTIIRDIQNRIYQQELGARSIQTDMNQVNENVVELRNGTNSGNEVNVNTYKTEFLQRLKSIVNSMNSTYDGFFIYGGNDMTTVPFKLDTDLEHEGSELNENSISLTYSHNFPSENEVKNIKITYKFDEGTEAYKASYSLVDDQGNETDDSSEETALKYLLSAMREQGRMSTGYGSLRDRSTLLDTYTGGLNMITGLSSDTLRALDDEEAIKRITGEGVADGKVVPETNDSMLNSTFALVSRAILTSQQYETSMTEFKRDQISQTDLDDSFQRFHDDLGYYIQNNNDAESRVSNTYRALGVKYEAMEVTKDRLAQSMDSLTIEYTDKLGIDPYEAIVKMYSNQYAYNAAMKVGSNIMQSSLFDFVR